jgi:hypothetical protein
LVNPLSNKILYDFPNIKNYLKESQTEIITAEASKLVDIVALSLSNG